jgi:hypothetical protein
MGRIPRTFTGEGPLLTCTTCSHRVSARNATPGTRLERCPRCGGTMRRTSPREAARAAMRGTEVQKDLHTALRRRLLGHGG